MDMSQLDSLLSVQQVADMFEVPARIVRKGAKNGTIPGTYKILGKYGFDPEQVTSWEPPEAGTRVVGAKREDGRQRYRIYLTPEELAKLQTEGYELADPREAAKARRAAKRAAKKAKEEGQTEAPETVEDPFKEFGD